MLKKVVLGLLSMAVTEPAWSQPAIQSAQSSLVYLKNAMDQFHDRFPVYDDVSSAGNHFHVYAKLPNGGAAVTMNGAWPDNPHSGATAIRCVYEPLQPFAGFYLQNGTLMGAQTTPQANWGTEPNAGINLTGATTLTFWVRGAVGGEQIEFFVAGVGRNAVTGVPVENYPDSSPRWPVFGSTTTLTTSWQKVQIDVTGLDLGYVLGGFGWVASTLLNPEGATFFLDDIQYELSPQRLEQRLNEPRFIRSFTTLSLQPDPFDPEPDGDIDFVLRNTAFTYDNALAVLAFLADGSPDSVRRARLIGDAFVYATTHDRTYSDDRACNEAVTPLTVHGARLRAAYAAGDIALPPGWTPNGRSGTVPIPGFYVDATETFYEVEQQALDVGNDAWAVIALNALFMRTTQSSYSNAACRLGNFVRSFRNDSGTYRGFQGGVNAPESAPVLRPWASSEHNLDIYAAFSGLYRTTGNSQWQQDAQHALEFVEAMWDSSRNCFLAGTKDPATRNTDTGTLPLDAQAWSVLAIPGMLLVHPGVLACAENNHLTASDGFQGFDFNEDKDGVWFEGTGQMATAYSVTAQDAKAQIYRQQLRAAQAAPVGDGKGIAAASHDGLSTGFLTAGNQPFKYFRRLHTGATSWNVFAQLEINPYYLSYPLPPQTFDTHLSETDALLTWTAVSDAVSYDVERSDGSAYVVIASTASLSTTDSGITAGHAYLYRVRSKNAAGIASGWSVPDLMTAVSFTDDPLSVGTLVKAAHLSELRTGINAVRALAGLPPATVTDDSVVRAVHISELRTALAAARELLGLQTLTFSHPTLQPGVSIISAADFIELREGIR